MYLWYVVSEGDVEAEQNDFDDKYTIPQSSYWTDCVWFLFFNELLAAGHRA